MKKRILVLTLFAVLALTVSACGDTTTPETTTPADVTEENKVCAIPIAEYSGEDFDAFLDEWASVQPSDGPPIVIPTLQSSDFRFFAVEVRENSYSYFYHPSDPSKMEYPDTPFFDSASGIWVCVSRTEDTFEAVLEQNDLVPTNGIAYDAEHNTWYADVYGICVHVIFPDTVVFEDAGELADYFTFKVYDTTDESNDLEIDVEYPPEYSGNDWAAYLDWLQTQLNDGADSPSVKVPILQSSEYQFVDVEVNQYGYSYIYSAAEGQFDVNTGITVTVSREEDSFEAVLDQFDLTATDGRAYVYSRNTWYIDNDGKWISINFPGYVSAQEADMLDDYFTFETITASEVTQ